MIKHWRRRFNAPNGDVVIRYTGMFHCICGGRVPFIDTMYTRELLENVQGSSLRQLVRVKRKDALKTLLEFVLTSELCHDGEEEDSDNADLLRSARDDQPREQRQ